MRRTGKLYALTLVSSAMTIFASLLACFWNENSSALHLWVDLIPQGFGMASFITSTLIVRFRSSPFSPISKSDNSSSRPWSQVFIRKIWLWLPEVRGPTGNKVWILIRCDIPVTYLFRTTGQVLGVSLSGTILQAVLLQKLRERISGPAASEASIVEFILKSKLKDVFAFPDYICNKVTLLDFCSIRATNIKILKSYSTDYTHIRPPVTESCGGFLRRRLTRCFYLPGWHQRLRLPRLPSNPRKPITVRCFPPLNPIES